MNSNPSTSQSLSTSHEASAELISRRAYEIWEQEGRPEGRDLQHWLQAEQELSAKSNGSTQSASLQPNGKNEAARFDEVGTGKLTDTRPPQTSRVAASTSAKKPSPTTTRGASPATASGISPAGRAR
jgi:hypothetical protein